MQASVVFGKLTEGFLYNCELFAGTLLFALPLGLLIAFGSMSRFALVRAPVKTFVWIIRGTPLMLQLIIIFFGPGLILHVNNPWPNRFLAALVAFVINYACYFSEIYRGGIQSIPRGQQEAGQVLGMTKAQIFFKVTLLQVVKRIMPPIGNEVITLVKDTSLARLIAVYEVIDKAQDFVGGKGLIWPLFATGLYFLAFVGILTLFFGYLEKRMNYFKA